MFTKGIFCSLNIAPVSRPQISPNYDPTIYEDVVFGDLYPPEKPWSINTTTLIVDIVLGSIFLNLNRTGVILQVLKVVICGYKLLQWHEWCVRSIYIHISGPQGYTTFLNIDGNEWPCNLEMLLTVLYFSNKKKFPILAGVNRNCILLVIYL